MADRGAPTFTPLALGNGSRPGASARPLGRRRTLPGSRAVVGGLLVAASAVGLFAAYGSSQQGPSITYVVAAKDIPEGEVLAAADLTTVALDLPAAQHRVTYSHIENLVGQVAAVRVKPGQLLQESLVVNKRSRRTNARISVPVEPGNAMNGEDLKGEQVDVIVTYTEGGAPKTVTVAEGVTVAEVLTGDRNLGTSGQLTVVLSVRPQDLEAIAGAAAAGKITLARTTGIAR
jgi:Flp pilus assembly protein CpaB